VIKGRKDMQDKFSVLFVLIFLALSGCATQKTLVPTGGSKSDGTVDLAYEVGLFEEPIVDSMQGLNAAKERCKAWGYKNAESFGGSKSDCQQFNGYGNCVRQIVTITYQCLD
jgi:YecR-like lipoprotein